jgi:hypothetical protein
MLEKGILEDVSPLCDGFICADAGILWTISDGMLLFQCYGRNNSIQFVGFFQAFVFVSGHGVWRLASR